MDDGGAGRRPAAVARIAEDRDRPKRTSVVVVVVTYNSAALIPSCLDSLVDAAGEVKIAEIVVVDNASQDDTLALAVDRPGTPVRGVQLGRNAGYAAGINAGLKSLAGRDYDAVLILNPDVRLHARALDTLVRSLGVENRSIIVPRLLAPDGSVQRSLRRRPSIGRALAEAIVGGARAGRFGERVTEADRYDRAGPVDWATGAALVVSRAAVADLGEWDESFLLYSEETEYELRAADRGRVVWYEPTAVAEHAGGESGTNPMLYALLTVNRTRLFRRRHGRVAAATFYLVLTLGEAVRAAMGRRTSRAAVTALVRPSRRPRELPQ